MGCFSSKPTELITGDSPNAENNIAAVATPLPVAFAEKAKNKA